MTVVSIEDQGHAFGGWTNVAATPCGLSVGRLQEREAVGQRASMPWCQDQQDFVRRRIEFLRPGSTPRSAPFVGGKAQGERKKLTDSAIPLRLEPPASCELIEKIRPRRSDCHGRISHFPEQCLRPGLITMRPWAGSGACNARPGETRPR